MLFIKNKVRAQTSVEYMLAIAMTITFVAAIMVGGFRELELDLALSAARMGGSDFTAINSNYTLGQINFTVNEETNVIDVQPYFFLRGAIAVSAAELTEAKTMCFDKMRRVFRPGESEPSADYCFDATYRRYCVSPVMTPA